MSRAIAITATLGLALGAAACGGDDAGDEAATGGGGTEKGPKIAAIYLDKFEANDYGKMWKQVLESVAKSTNAEDLRLVESVGYTDQLTQTTSTLFRQGYDIVIDTNSGGPLFYTACEQAAEGTCIEYYPVKGMPENTAGFWLDYILATYLQGVGAGKVTKTGTIGFVNAFKNPLDLATVNAYVLGCQSVRPDCKARNVYINSYFDPPKSIEATNALIDGGADVIAHILDDPSPNRTAQRRGVKSFNFIAEDPATRESNIATTLFTDTITKVLTDQVQSVIDGNFEAQTTLYAKPEPMDIEVKPGENAPPEATEAMAAALEKINAGESPFQGPITDTKGKVRVQEGESLDPRSDAVNYEWDWAVDGLIGG